MRFGALKLLLASLAFSTGYSSAVPASDGLAPRTPQDAAPAETAPPEIPEIPELTALNFRSTIEKGYWFVKGYSPTCPHCRRAAPVWKALGEHYLKTPPPNAGLSAPKDNAAGPSFTEVYDFHFADLNCLAYGDLCSELKIEAWPKFIIFKDGEEWDVYKHRAEITAMTQYMEETLDKIKPGSRPDEMPIIPVPKKKKSTTPKEESKEETPKKEAAAAPKGESPKDADVDKKPANADKKDTDADKKLAPKAEEQKPPAKPKLDQDRPNKLGQSVNLDSDSFQKRVMHSRDKWFIKFYAPWCGHCQAMAPAWFELGREMEGKLNIGEVNCDIEKNLCKTIGLRGYPTIYYFQNGEKVEYDGLRGVGDLVDFANQAVNSAVKDVDAESWNEIAKAENFEVAFLYFYDVATTSEDFAALDRLTLNLVGHAPLYKTQDDELAKKYKVYSRPKLMVLRDKKPTFYKVLAPQDIRHYDKVLNWMKSVWLPIVPELSAANSHEIMNRRYVVLGILDRRRQDDFIRAKKELKEAALEFMEQRETEEKNERKELRDKKQLRIEEAEDKNDERALKAAKNQRIQVSEKKEVVFAWVDGIFWERWIRSTYGIDPKEEHERIIINDEATKRYWDITVDNGPITASRSRILETLKAVLSSPPKIVPKSSTGRMESAYIFLTNSGTKILWGFVGTFALLALAFWGRGRIRRRAAGYFRLDGKEGLTSMLSGVAGGKKD
ncbi:thioredoxin-domain-containing protein [Ascodesmis nigricans]|uniref:Thioredoxin-domain-containing protein n=1 Tax=Ascodesmis nigricans TaxID=341454 RepID=A0A4S2MY44_9PEZI|nr:thioredoxin-domain-containing protein [Ascodesmis nigricans]